MAQRGYCPSGSSPQQTGAGYRPKTPSVGAELRLPPLARSPCSHSGCCQAVELPCLPQVLSTSAGRMDAIPRGCPEWELGTGMCRPRCPGCGQPPRAICRQAAVCASLFAGAASVTSSAPAPPASPNPGQLGQVGRRLPQAFLLQTRGWERSLTYPRRGCSPGMEVPAALGSWAPAQNRGPTVASGVEQGSGGIPAVSPLCDIDLLTARLRIKDP